MVERFDERDRKALAALTNTPPNLKVHSHSHQLRTNTGGHNKRRPRIRNHSLDDDQIPPNIEHYCHSSSDDDDFFPYATTTSAGGHSSKAYDTSKVVDEIQQPLPEFVASGGDDGIFRAPTREAVHPGRPPFLELRPHPLRETQIGKFLRTIACTDSQLWGGQESGVRVWNLTDAYRPGIGMDRRGDEDAAPFYESVNTSPTLCLIIDSASKLVWSGHKDGRIRSWKMDHQPLDDTPFKEGLSWQAHRGPILSMVISSHGKSSSFKFWPIRLYTKLYIFPYIASICMCIYPILICDDQLQQSSCLFL